MFSAFSMLRKSADSEKDLPRLRGKHTIRSCQKYSDRFYANSSQHTTESVGEEPPVQSINEFNTKHFGRSELEKELKYFRDKVLQISKEKSAVEKELFQTAQLAKELEIAKRKNVEEIKILKARIGDLEGKVSQSDRFYEELKYEMDAKMKEAINLCENLKAENKFLKENSLSRNNYCENSEHSLEFDSLVTVLLENSSEELGEHRKILRNLISKVRRHFSSMENFEVEEYSIVHRDWVSFIACQASLLEEILLG